MQKLKRGRRRRGLTLLVVIIRCNLERAIFLVRGTGQVNRVAFLSRAELKLEAVYEVIN